MLSNYELVNLFINKNQIIEDYKIVGLEYYTIPEEKGRTIAANKIISLFRMVFSKKFYKNLGALMKKVKIIQKHWRNSLLVKKTRR